MAAVGRGPRRNVRCGALLVAALAVVATGCAGGPAADRAAKLDAVADSSDEADDADTEAGDGNGNGTDGATEPPTPPGGSSSEEPDPTPQDPPPPDEVVEVDVQRVELPEISDPWGLAVLPDGGVLIGSRDTVTIHHYDPENGDFTDLGDIHAAKESGDGVLLGLTVDDMYVYAFYTTSDDSRVARYQHKGTAGNALEFVDGSRVIQDLPKGETRLGGALARDAEDFLYVSMGDTGSAELASDQDSLAGSILGVRVASSSPTHEGQTTGHRNVTGLTVDTVGRLWAVGEEDEGALGLHVLDPSPADEGTNGGDAASDPVRTWETSESAPGLAYAAAALWTGGEDGELVRIPLDGAEISADPQDFTDEGLTGPVGNVTASDDAVWALIGGPGAEELVRITVED